MAENGDSTYNNANRGFLQAFLARSTLTYDQAKPIIAAILTAQDKREALPEDVTEADFNAFISAANNAISPFDLEIRSTLHQTSRIRTYAIVNLTEDPIIQLATTYSADEIGFLKRVLDAMFETNNTKRHEVMAITSMQAMRLCKPPSENRRETQNGSNTQGSTGQGVTHMQAESMLKNLVEEGWFERSRKGYYSLTPRTLMELRGWLFETYNDLEDEGDEEEEVRTMKIKQCYACKDIITTGQRCSKNSCQCRLHDICTQNFFRIQKAKKCPLCKVDWTGNDFVGERAAATTEKARRNNAGSAGRRNTQNNVDGESDEAEVYGEGSD